MIIQNEEVFSVWLQKMLDKVDKLDYYALFTELKKVQNIDYNKAISNELAGKYIVSKTEFDYANKVKLFLDTIERIRTDEEAEKMAKESLKESEALPETNKSTITPKILADATQANNPLAPVFWTLTTVFNVLLAVMLYLQYTNNAQLEQKIEQKRELLQNLMEKIDQSLMQDTLSSTHKDILLKMKNAINQNRKQNKE